MSIQTTFRDVSKPTVVSKSAAPAGGVLVLEEGTLFLFEGLAVTTYTSLSTHEYLVNGQPIWVENRHATNDLIFTIGAFSRTIPAGYKSILFYNESGTTFYDVAESWKLKELEDDIDTNATDIGNEATARANEDLTFVKLDGTRAMTADFDAGGFQLKDVADSSIASDAVNRGELDTEVLALEAQISAASSDLNWKPVVEVITEFTTGSIPANDTALVDSTFGAGIARLFEDDEGPAPFTAAAFAVDQYVVFTKAGEEPKLMVVRDDLGTKKWFDETEADTALQLDRDQISAGDTFITKNDMIDSPDSHENTAIYHTAEGVPKTMIKIGDVDWDQATGINLSGGYAAGAGVVAGGDSVEAAIEKLDGNVQQNVTNIGTNATNIGNNTTAISNHATDLASNANGEGASLIGIEDATSQFTATTAEGAFDELKDDLEAHVSTTASTSIGEGAALTGINDAGSIITATNVEGALQENRTQIDANESDISTLVTDVGTNTTNIGTNTTNIGTNATAISDLETDLASVAAGEGASKIGVEDAGGNFTGTTVEAVLTELFNATSALNLVEHQRGLHEAASTGATTLNLTTNFVDVLGGGGVVQDLSAATYLNTWVVRDGAVLVGGTGYTIAANIITFTAAGGGELLEDEVIEVRIVNIS